MGVLRLGVMCGVGNRRDVAAGLDAVAAVGIERIQVTASGPVPPSGWADILGQCQNRGIAVAAIGCYANLVRPRDRTLHGASAEDALVALRALGVAGVERPQVVVWSGTFGNHLLAADRRNRTLATWDALVAVAAAMARQAHALGGRILIEPYHRHCLATPRDYLLFLRDALDAAGVSADPAAAPLGVVLDPPNLLSAADLDDLDANLAEAVEALGAWAGLVHLKDIASPSGPAGVPALPAPGEGRIAYPEYLRRLTEGVNGEVAAIAEHFDFRDPAALRRVTAFLVEAGVRP